MFFLLFFFFLTAGNPCQGNLTKSAWFLEQKRKPWWVSWSKSGFSSGSTTGVWVRSNENFSPHSVAYKSPQGEHTVQQCCVKRQQYDPDRPSVLILQIIALPLCAPSQHPCSGQGPAAILREQEQRNSIHLCHHFYTRDAKEVLWGQQRCSCECHRVRVTSSTDRMSLSEAQ